MRKQIFLAILTLLVAVSCARLLTVSAAVEEVDVVVNKTNGLSSLSREELRKIFMGEKSSWPGGKRITVLMLGNEDASDSKSKRHRLPQKGRRGRQREGAAEDSVTHSMRLER
jgi:ABC-type phosphate transport system substrate-binding protein